MVRSETGTSKTLGQDDIGHPQLVQTFWHSFGHPAKNFGACIRCQIPGWASLLKVRHPEDPRFYQRVESLP
jgi:hypothetical protein